MRFTKLQSVTLAYVDTGRTNGSNGYMFNAYDGTSAFSALRSTLKKFGFREGHVNREYLVTRGITYKDSDVFYFYRKGFGREDNVAKIKHNKETEKRWRKVAKKRLCVPRRR